MRARLAQLTVLAIASEAALQATLRRELALVRELRVVATSQLARQAVQGWRPSVVVWRLDIPTLHDLSLAHEIRHCAIEPPPIIYLHRDSDAALLLMKLEQLVA